MTATDVALVDVACALCGATRRRERFAQEPFTVWQCAECALVYVSPRVPDEWLIDTVYDATYWRSEAPRERGYANYLTDDAAATRTWDRRWKALDAWWPAAGAVLDVGCANAGFLDRARAAGLSAYGLEPSHAAHRRAIDRIGAHRILRQDLGTARAVRPDGWPDTFELVTLWDVLEHLPDPVAALRQAREWLAPGGRIVIETQDVASVAARLLGRRWHHYKHVEHLVHFDRATLERALTDAGLRAVHWTRKGAGKAVRWSFLVERSARLGGVAHALVRGLAKLAGRLDPLVYVNPCDQWIVVAEELPVEAPAADVPAEEPEDTNPRAWGAAPPPKPRPPEPRPPEDQAA
jgi:SAM-dependent methyltransferase